MRHWIFFSRNGNASLQYDWHCKLMTLPLDCTHIDAKREQGRHDSLRRAGLAENRSWKVRGERRATIKQELNDTAASGIQSRSRNRQRIPRGFGGFGRIR